MHCTHHLCIIPTLFSAAHITNTMCRRASTVPLNWTWTNHNLIISFFLISCIACETYFLAPPIRSSTFCTTACMTARFCIEQNKVGYHDDKFQDFWKDFAYVKKFNKAQQKATAFLTQLLEYQPD